MSLTRVCIAAGLIAGVNRKEAEMRKQKANSEEFQQMIAILQKDIDARTITELKDLKHLIDQVIDSLYPNSDHNKHSCKYDYK